MSLESEINRDVKETEDEAPNWFLWDGVTYKTTPDKFTREVAVSVDGNPEVIDLSLRCRVELFANHVFPRSGELVRFPVASDGSDMPESENFRVRRTRSKQFAILWVDCVSTET